MNLFLKLKVIVVRCYIRQNQMWMNLESVFSFLFWKSRVRVDVISLKQKTSQGERGNWSLRISKTMQNLQESVKEAMDRAHGNWERKLGGKGGFESYILQFMLKNCWDILSKIPVHLESIIKNIYILLVMAWN